MDYNKPMKIFSWDADKNVWLKAHRGVSFEEVLFHIERGELLDRLAHPNKSKYPGQNLFVVNINDYAFLVPFVETEREFFLKRSSPVGKQRVII
jgi:hypothetical protein